MQVLAALVLALLCVGLLWYAWREISAVPEEPSSRLRETIRPEEEGPQDPMEEELAEAPTAGPAPEASAPVDRSGDEPEPDEAGPPEDDTSPAEPVGAAEASTEPEPTDPGPTDPDPADPGSTDPGSTDPGPDPGPLGSEGEEAPEDRGADMGLPDYSPPEAEDTAGADAAEDDEAGEDGSVAPEGPEPPPQADVGPTPSGPASAGSPPGGTADLDYELHADEDESGEGFRVRVLPDGDPVPWRSLPLEEGLLAFEVADVDRHLDVAQLAEFAPGQAVRLVPESGSEGPSTQAPPRVAVYDASREYRVGYVPEDRAELVAELIRADPGYRGLILWETAEDGQVVGLRALITASDAAIRMPDPPA